MDICDKCGQKVPLSNSVNLFDWVLTHGKGGPRINADAIMAVVLRDEKSGISRHLLPVFENGKIVCEGSPSQAQYLPGQPRDSRGQYPLDEDAIPLMRRTYEIMQAIANLAIASTN